MTMLEQNMPLSTDDCNLRNSDIDINNIQIPIVGYEIMEERARFTVSEIKFVLTHRKPRLCTLKEKNVFQQVGDSLLDGSCQTFQRARNYPQIVFQ